MYFQHSQSMGKKLTGIFWLTFNWVVCFHFFFFFIDNKSFIEYIVFTVVNKLYLKQLQTNQEEEITDCRKSKMEKHCVKP